jgi:hypothetical protein
VKKNFHIKKKYNIFKKIFIKIVRKLGFEIIDQNNFSIPTSNASINDNISIFNKKHITLPLGEIKITRKVDSFLIIFRSFTNENKLLSQNKKRIFEKSKKEYSLRSLRSVCKSINKAKNEIKGVKFFLKIIDDNSKPDVINKIKNIALNNKINFELTNLDISKYKSRMKFKNNKRMLAHNAHIFDSKIYAKNSDYDLIYFVEDDYIHNHNSIIEMIYSYQKFSTLIKEDIILCPSDYPYLYNKLSSTSILAGHRKHWRRVGESLCTYLVSKKLLLKNWKYYEEMFLNNFDPYEKPLHKLYKKTYCLSPIPSLAIHMTNVNSSYGLSPFINFKKIWDENQ